MLTSPNKNIFRVTGPLWGECTGHRWIPLATASNWEFWCFLWSAPEQTVEHTIDTLVIWDAIALIMKSLYWASSNVAPYHLQNIKCSCLTYNIPIFHMFVDMHCSLLFCTGEARQFLILCNVMVPHLYSVTHLRRFKLWMLHTPHTFRRIMLAVTKSPLFAILSLHPLLPTNLYKVHLKTPGLVVQGLTRVLKWA